MLHIYYKCLFDWFELDIYKIPSKDDKKNLYFVSYSHHDITFNFSKQFVDINYFQLPNKINNFRRLLSVTSTGHHDGIIILFICLVEIWNLWLPLWSISVMLGARKSLIIVEEDIFIFRLTSAFVRGVKKVPLPYTNSNSESSKFWFWFIIRMCTF